MHGEKKWQPLKLAPDRPNDFQAIFNYQNPRADQIARLVAAVHPRYTEHFSSSQIIWKQIVSLQESFLASKNAQFFRGHLHDRILVHLGGTATPFIDLNQTQLKGVIHVDRFHSFLRDADTTPLDPYTPKHHERTESGVAQWWLKADMLDVVSRIPDNSVNIEMDGINRDIITNRDYEKVLLEELVRILRPDGILFGADSVGLHTLSERSELEQIELSRVCDDAAYVFKKRVTTQHVG